MAALLFVDSDGASRSGREDNILEAPRVRPARRYGKFETIELPPDAWRVLRLAERTRSFDEEGYYLHTQPVADVEKEAPPEIAINGLQATFARDATPGAADQ